MATLKDIADMVGISVSAASLAIRDHDSISEETKRRVWGAQKKLGYQPNLARRARMPKRTGAPKAMMDIAFVLIDRDFSDQHYARKFQAVTKFAKAHQFRPIYVAARLDELHSGRLPYLLEGPEVRGMIVSGNYDTVAHGLFCRMKIPLVVSGNYSLGNTSWSACEIDLGQGVRLMADRFHEMGHQKVTLVVRSPGTQYTYDIECAYRRHAELKGMRFDHLVLHEEPGNLRVQLEALLKNPDRPTAMILSTDGLAPDVLDAVEKMGMKVPEDLSLAGFEGGYHLLRPTLATVGADFNEIGRVTLRKLFDQINDPTYTPTREILGMNFHPGGTVGPPSRS